MHPELPALRLRPLRLERALAERRHLEVAHDPLQAQEQPIVHEPRIVNAIVIDQDNLRDGPQLHQLRPIAIVAREPRRFERQDGACRARADGREQPLKARALGEARPGDPQIVVDRFHAVET
jgi:hypothetical protein